MANRPYKIKLSCLIFYLLFMGANNLFAQKTDSLISLLKPGKEDTTQVKLLNDIAWQLWKVGRYDSSMFYAETAKKMAVSIDYKKGIASAYCNIGNNNENKGNYSEALRNFNAALKLAQQINDQKAMASCYNNIGIVYENQSNYPDALKNYITAFNLYEKIGYKKGVAFLHNGIGGIYKLQGNNQEALKRFSAALEMLKLSGDKKGMLSAYSNLGNLYSNLGNKDEALKHISLALTIAKEINSSESISNCYNDIANIYADQGNYPEALKNYFASLKIADETGLKLEMAIACGNIGEVYKDIKNYSEAKKYLNKALEIGLEIGNIETIVGHYSLLAEVDYTLGDYKAAYEHNKLYFKYNDSLYNEENARQINELAAKYESEKKEKEIALLNADLANKQRNVEGKNKTIIATLFSSALLLAVVLLFFSRRQLKQKREINEQQKNIAAAIIQAQEKERNRMAKDLHDGVGTFLSTLKINLQLLENAVVSENTQSYRNVLELTDKTSIELRNITKNISSETLLESGLKEALEELTQGINRLGIIQLEFITHGITTRLEEIIEVTLYRVAQELVANCVKHAKASKATLQLIAHEDSILLMMEDNGKGLSTQASKPEADTGGMGLKNISDRVNFIKGTLKIESNPGRGTTFIIEAPKFLL